MSKHNQLDAPPAQPGPVHRSKPIGVFAMTIRKSTTSVIRHRLRILKYAILPQSILFLMASMAGPLLVKVHSYPLLTFSRPVTHELSRGYDLKSSTEITSPTTRFDVSCIDIEECKSKVPGCFSVRFTIDRNYTKMTLKLYELQGYSQATGKHRRKNLVYENTVKDLRRHPDPNHVFAIEFNAKDPPLPHGAYRITLKGEGSDSKNNNSCEFQRKFDGKFGPLPGSS